MRSDYEYQYPNNLNEKPKVLFWTFTEILIVVAVAMGSLILFLRSKNLIPVAFAGILALMLAHIDERSIWQYLMDKIKYLVTSNIWEYNPEINPNILKEESNFTQTAIDIENKKKQAKKKNALMIILMIVIMIVFVGLMFLSSSLSRRQKSPNNSPETTETKFNESNEAKLDGKGEATFYENTVTIQQGEEYDVAENISAISDDTGATYKEVEKTTELVPDSYCIISDNFNPDIAGEYKISILISDDDQKYSTSDYKIVVQPNEDATPQS